MHEQWLKIQKRFLWELKFGIIVAKKGFNKPKKLEENNRGAGDGVYLTCDSSAFTVLITFCLSSHHHLLLPSDILGRWKSSTGETLAAFQVAASGERTPARSAVGAAAFQFAKTTFRFVRAGDLWITSHFIKCCQSQSALVEPELCAEGLQQRPGSGSSSRDYERPSCPEPTGCIRAPANHRAAVRFSPDDLFLLLNFAADTSTEGVCVCVCVCVCVWQQGAGDVLQGTLKETTNAERSSRALINIR